MREQTLQGGWWICFYSIFNFITYYIGKFKKLGAWPLNFAIVHKDNDMRTWNSLLILIGKYVGYDLSMVKESLTTILVTVNIRLALVTFVIPLRSTSHIYPYTPKWLIKLKLESQILLIIYKLKIHLINTHVGFELYLHNSYSVVKLEIFFKGTELSCIKFLSIQISWLKNYFIAQIIFNSAKFCHHIKIIYNWLWTKLKKKIVRPQMFKFPN